MSGNAENLIKLQIDGVESEEGHIRLDDFLQKLENLLAALNGIDRIVGDTSKATLYYRVVDAQHSSPISITVEPVIRKRITRPSSNHIKIRHDRFFQELEAIEKAQPISPEIDENLLEHLKDLASGSGKEFKQAVISNNTAKVNLDQKFESNVSRLLQEEDASYGGFEGKLEAVNIHGNNRRVWIYPVLGPQRVRCDFMPGTSDAIKAALGHHVRVEGVKYFRPQSPYPFRISVKEFEIMDEENYPHISALRGIAPEATGKMSSVDFVRSIREEWD